MDPLVERLYATTDAQVWAEGFLRVVDGMVADGHSVDHPLTEGFMIGWFANAIETGRAAGRSAMAEELERQIRPLIHEPTFKGGYDCCGCSTYDQILDHAIALVRGEVSSMSRPEPPDE